ncbi:complement C3-like [Triplophysa dalaica]|uniref:complement C3-like n=1 Tax=Triplophysa dalaica TaxID=1582913 RepID=UPI0024DFC047|nr:complement C3-like [Triplophysa dalaica]
MRVEIIFWVTAAFLSSPLISTCESNPLHVMIAPQILKVGAVTNVFVEIQDNNNPQNTEVNIRIQNFPSRDKDLHVTKVTLTTENKFQSLAKVKIPDRNNIFDVNSREKQYVYLEARFPDRRLEKIVLVTFQSGYIFVQTDKTIYTPDSTVKYRIFALDTSIKPTDNPVIVEIVTPDGIVVKYLEITPDEGLKTQEYKLDSPIRNGIWQIAVKYSNNPYLNYTARFEVKEYVLPSFEVTLNPESPFFYIDDEKLRVKVQARFLFGKPVEGNVLAVFGIQGNQRKINLPASIQRAPINEGEGIVELKRSDIFHIYQNDADLNNKILFVSVSVRSVSGETVEATRGGIHIATTPYSIQFIRTPKYFKKGMPFDFTVYVTNPDKTPVGGLKVELVDPAERNLDQQNSEQSTDSNGLVKFSINTGTHSTGLKIKVRTQDPRISLDRQGVNEMEAYPYNPKAGSQNFLHIHVTNRMLEVGETVQFNLHPGDPAAGNQQFTYMILSKGHIVSVGSYTRSGNSQIVLNIKVTKDMVPSFRFVAYYHVGSDEVVSDSVWVDVKDTCMGTLKVQKDSKSSDYRPSGTITLTITGDPGAKVGLVAVDKGIYVLNNMNRLTQAKIWDYVEKNDIGCTAGSGRDSMGVFYDAGLLFQSDTAKGTENRREFSCPSAPKRRRRDVDVRTLRNTLVGEFNGTLKKCCMDGMVKNLLDYTCERRSEYIEDGEECRLAFLRCCSEMIRMEENTIETELILARSDDDDDEDDESIEQSFKEFTTRKHFDESWLWEIVNLPSCESCEESSVSIKKTLKDSITTWVITAISLSKDKGICVATPEEAVVKTNFFIDLKLPYSAVVKEQIEIKAVIHNSITSSKKEKVYVELLPTDRICSEAGNKKKHRKTIEIEPMKSYSVTFTIVPLDIGHFDIEVRAVLVTMGTVDAVKKELKVVTNGVLTTANEFTHDLDPAQHSGNQILRIQRPKLKDQMPNTDAKTHIRVRGSPLDQLTEQAVSGEDLGRFIQKPYGCAEQNMLRLALPVIATHYLDKTNRWNDVGVDKRTDALEHISTGVMTELVYRNSDNSFGFFSGSPGSMWLTAYVVKMFSIATNLVPIDRQVICGAIKWLTSKQLGNGAFQQQGLRSVLYDTAYVLVALQEGRVICSKDVPNLEDYEKKSIAYIESQISSEKDPSAVAIALYTLANSGKHNKNIFQKYFIVSSDGSYWKDTNFLSKLEATGYALLTLVKIKDFGAAEPVVRWLQKHQKHMGDYGSSQTTAVVYQALAKYFEEVKPADHSDLVVTVSPTARRSTTLRFTKGTEGLRHSDKFNADTNLTVNAIGTGKGSISVLTLYYAKPGVKNTDCNFELNVDFQKDQTHSSEGSPISYKLTIEIRFLLTDRNADMTILDIGLMTGFEADTTKMDKLVNGVDRYIQKYEFNKELSERGSLIIYLNTVSNMRKEKLVLTINKMINVDTPQPASVSIYEYYSTEKPCVEFYDTQREKGLLDTLCHSEVCLCAEENCPKVLNRETTDNRHNVACDGRTDYVYVAVLDSVNTADKKDVYKFHITNVIKEGSETDVQGKKRDFSAHIRCQSKMKLKPGDRYLIMGPVHTSLEQSYWYSLTARTWLEYWPTGEANQVQEKALTDKMLHCG